MRRPAQTSSFSKEAYTLVDLDRSNPKQVMSATQIFNAFCPWPLVFVTHQQREDLDSSPNWRLPGPFKCLQVSALSSLRILRWAL